MSSSASNWWQIAPYPSDSGSVISTSTTSTAATALAKGGGRYMFKAYGANAFVRFGTSTVGAAAATTGSFGMDIPAGSTTVLYLPDSVTHFRVIADTGTGTITFGKVGN